MWITPLKPGAQGGEHDLLVNLMSHPALPVLRKLGKERSCPRLFLRQRRDRGHDRQNSVFRLLLKPARLGLSESVKKQIEIR